MKKIIMLLSCVTIISICIYFTGNEQILLSSEGDVADINLIHQQTNM